MILLLAYGLALVSAQTSATAPSPADAELHLIQLSVPAQDYTVEEFREITRPIQACEQARNVAQQKRIRLVENRSLKTSQLPTAVQRIIEDLPIGKPSTAFGEVDKIYKVLIVCRRMATSLDG